MANPIIINARLNMKRTALDKESKALKALRDKQANLLRAAEDAENEDDLDAVDQNNTELEKQITDLQSKVDALTKQVEDLQAELDKANEPVDADGTDEAGDGTDNKKGARSKMGVITITPDATDEAQAKQTRSMIDFVNTKGEKRAGITSTDIGAIIPKQLVYKAQDEVKTAYDLSQFADVIKVNEGGGSYVVAKKVDDALVAQEELAANPDLGKPDLINVDWALKTYRGQMSGSNESLDDAQDLNQLIQRILEQKVLNTNNKQLAAIYATAPAAVASTTDEVKKIINVDLDPAYLINGAIVASQSAFQILDTLKDGEGRYLMQPDVTSPTKRSFLGLPVAVIGDALFGKAGEAHAFIGDSKRFAKMFTKGDVYLSYEQFANFGKGFVAAIRADYKAADTNAGRFVTLTAPTAPAGK